MKVLITGGAGFIGSHLADELIDHGYEVRVLDCLDAQIHGPDQQRPEYLHPAVELMVGDVRVAGDVQRALVGVDAVYHLAAAVGVGQSMYEMSHYTSVNNLGTSRLLEELAIKPVERLIVASSMSVYGEGQYVNAEGKPMLAEARSLEQLQQHDWQCRSNSGQLLAPVPTPESKMVEPSSVYALGKWDQERMCLLVGNAYHIPTVALRFFNVYGPRQALSNPYTGVLAIFASRYLNQAPPLIFEDGEQQRDFVHVTDIARACRLALESPAVDQRVFNIGSGQSVSVRQIAETLGSVMGMDSVQPIVTQRYRTGDIRHCFADISQAKQLLDYQPQVPLEQGMRDYVDWLADQHVTDCSEKAQQELMTRGLAI